MRRIVIDFETKSNVDLLNEGLMRYATDSSTDILMLGFKEVTENTSAQVWLPGEPIPVWFMEDQEVYYHAFNAEFEMHIWNNIGVKKYGFPQMQLKQIGCIAALANRYGFPNTLEAVGEALGCKQQKNPEGKVLIQVFCTPKHGWPTHTDSRWTRFIQYCKDDCLAEEEILLTLPSMDLSKDERAIWEHTVEMNANGIPVDIPSIKQIRRVAETYREAHYELLPELTNGKITKITQTKRIKDYCNDRGVYMENCTAHTVSELLEQDLPDDVMQLLEMRAQLGMSSIGKYIRFERMNKDGRIYFNQRYYGAHTGRWTGSGVQLFNLPRKQVDDPDAEINKFFTGDIVDGNPIKSARALIRAMIKAEPGKVLVWSDWSSIEYIILEWLAGNNKGVERFAAGFDQYVDQAAAMYQTPYESINKNQRQEGKVVVLGCGYGQGSKRLQVTADLQWGMKLTEEESAFLVNGYRKEHFLVVNMWYTLQRACVEAVENPGYPVKSHRCIFKVARDKAKHRWLVLTLPSGRNLFYFEPFIEPGLRGPEVCHYGFNQTIKKWIVMRMIPGRITENIVQATSRCILTPALAALRHKEILWSTYDEIIMQVDESNAQEELDNLNAVMCQQLPWCEGLPLRTEGFIMKRYRKM